MTNALTALNHGIAHHDWPLVERAARELRDQNTALAAENDRLWLERNNNLTNIRDLNTELDISRERMARPVTLIIAPAIGLWLSSLPCSTADAYRWRWTGSTRRSRKSPSRSWCPRASLLEWQRSRRLYAPGCCGVLRLWREGFEVRNRYPGICYRCGKMLK